MEQRVNDFTERNFAKQQRRQSITLQCSAKEKKEKRENSEGNLSRPLVMHGTPSKEPDKICIILSASTPLEE